MFSMSTQKNNVAGEVSRSALGGFSQILINAQFSQQEERQADDYGLFFVQEQGYGPTGALSALRKLASQGQQHTFLSSHPDPTARAQRLEDQLAGKAEPLQDSWFSNMLTKIKKLLALLLSWLISLLP